MFRRGNSKAGLLRLLILVAAAQLALADETSRQSPLSNECSYLLSQLRDLQYPSELIGILNNNDYTVNRRLSEFEPFVNPLLETTTASLTSEHVVIDFGTGAGALPMDLLSRYSDLRLAPTVYGVSLFPVRFPANPYSFSTMASRAVARFLERRTYLESAGKFVQLNYQPVELMEGDEFPKYDMGLDFFGAMVYAYDLSRVLNNEIGLQRTPNQSRLFTTVGSMGSPNTPEAGGIRYSYTAIVDRAGRVLTVQDWLKTQSQVTVTDHLAGYFSVTSNVPGARVADLELIFVDSNRPPTRIYRERGSNFDLDSTTFVDPRDGKSKILRKALEK